MQRDPAGAEERLIRECLDGRSLKVVEIGCGDGRLTGCLSAVAAILLAMDTAVAEVRRARSSAPAAARYVVASGQHLPLADNRMDSVVFTYSLHHQDPVRALAEANRVLRADGRILVLEPARDSLIVDLFAVIHDESGEYDRAEEAINISGLVVMASGSITTRWVFEDREELSAYIFDHFETSRNVGKELEMARLLGEKHDARPLVLEDITRYWLLGRKTGANQGPAR